MEPTRWKRSLTHVGGSIEEGGDLAFSAKLAEALAVKGAESEAPLGDGEGRAHVHGFHTYPARMHPDTAARLLEAFSEKGERILDPFMGSGTVIVEALRAGRTPTGSDLNPLAVELTRLKTRPLEPGEGAGWIARAKEIAAIADARRLARSGAPRRFPPEDVDAFDPHVLLELGSLQAAIQAIDGEEPARLARRALFLVLSSILVKLSRRRSDTAVGSPPSGSTPRRLAAGYPAKLFVKKTTELVARLDAAYPADLGPYPRPRVLSLDARALGAVAPRSIAAVITSPPYAATYDYLTHHALRLRWLGLEAAKFEAGEIGARRHYRELSPSEAAGRWRSELLSFLAPIARVLRPSGKVVLLLADSAVRGSALRADDLVGEIADEVGLTPIARATQSRPHFHTPTMAAFAERPRREHALLLGV